MCSHTKPYVYVYRYNCRRFFTWMYINDFVSRKKEHSYLQTCMDILGHLSISQLFKLYKTTAMPREYGKNVKKKNNKILGWVSLAIRNKMESGIYGI